MEEIDNRIKAKLYELFSYGLQPKTIYVSEDIFKKMLEIYDLYFFPETLGFAEYRYCGIPVRRISGALENIIEISI